MQREKDLYTLSSELEAIAGLAFSISNPLLEGENRMNDEIIGEAVYSIGSYIIRIAEDLAEYEERTLQNESGRDPGTGKSTRKATANDRTTAANQL